MSFSITTSRSTASRASERSRALRRWALGFVLALAPALPSAQFANGDFETGDLSGWLIEYGSTTCSGATGWTTSMPSSHPGASIHSSGSPFQPLQTLPVPPYEGQWMARLNDISGGNHATRISQKVVLTTADLAVGGIALDWGAMLQEPNNFHSAGCQPKFRVEILVDGAGIREFEANASEAGMADSGWEDAGGTELETYWYRRGSFCEDLSNFSAGQELEVRLTIEDCSLGGHGGLAYLDNVRFASCCVTPPLDMVGWWALDEPVSTGSMASDLAFGNDGAHEGPLTSSSDLVGGSLLFNGITTRVHVPDPVSGDLDVGPATSMEPCDFSIDAWIRTGTPVDAGTIVSKLGCVETSSSSCTIGYHFFVHRDRLALTLGQTGTSNTFYSVPIPSLLDEEWHFVAVTVERGSPAGLKFYFDGALVGAPIDASVFTGSLANSAPLEIGNSSGSIWSPAGFLGHLDEIELFKRALHAHEIRALWEAGPFGKCKEYCFLPPEVTYCPSDAVIDVPLGIRNGTAAARDYSIVVTPLPAGGDCDVDGPAMFSPAGPTVQPGATEVVTLSIPRPTGLITAGDVACYEVAVTNTFTGHTFRCEGRLGLLPPGPCSDPPNNVLLSPLGVATQLSIPIAGGLHPGNYTYILFPIGWVGEEDFPSGLSLDGEVPGALKVGSISIPAQGTVELVVDATPTKHLPFGTERVEVVMDIDGQGEFELAATVLLETAPPPQAGSDCDGNGLDDALDILADPSLDLDANGEMDACQLLHSDTVTLDIGAGGLQTLELDAGPAHLGSLYILLGSSTGTQPGLVVDGLTLPLVVDSYFLHTLQAPNAPPLANSFASLDAFGRSTSTFTVASLPPHLAGQTVHHAYVLLDFVAVGLKVVLTSNPWPLTFLP